MLVYNISKGIFYILVFIYINLGIDEDYQYFDYEGKEVSLKDISVKLKGKKQINNTVLCIEAANIIRKNGFDISDEAIKEGIKTVIHHGRMEKLFDNPLIIYDGAHNSPAMQNFIESIIPIFKKYSEYYYWKTY